MKVFLIRRIPQDLVLPRFSLIGPLTLCFTPERADKLVQQGVSLHWGRPKYEKLILILIGTTQFCIMRSSAIFKVEKRTTQIGGGGRLSRQWPFKSGIDTFPFIAKITLGGDLLGWVKNKNVLRTEQFKGLSGAHTGSQMPFLLLLKH